MRAVLSMLAARVRQSLRLARRLPRRSRRLLQGVLDARFRGTYARTLDQVPSREELPIVLNRRGLVGTAAEIGVKHGGYSSRFLSRWHGERLISIDPWLAAPADDYRDTANVPQDEHERFYRKAQGRLQPFGARSEIWRTTSIEAAPRIPDGSLDFVYIDARHDYDSVCEDIRAWYPKVRPSGILAGHDYIDGSLPGGEFGVRRAVDEFAAERGLKVSSTRGGGLEVFPTWMIVVPGDGAR